MIGEMSNLRMMASEEMTRATQREAVLRSEVSEVKSKMHYAAWESHGDSRLREELSVMQRNVTMGEQRENHLKLKFAPCVE
eukprot:3609830-Amphidinium_carterae.3